MNSFSKFVAGSLLGSFLFFPYLASSWGWGMASERNPEVMKVMQRDCPPHMRTAQGRCLRNHRSSYYNRGLRSGGMRGGK